MIEPQPHDDRLINRGKAFLTTSLLGIVCYVVMVFANIELGDDGSRRAFREVDLVSLMAPAYRNYPGSETPGGNLSEISLLKTAGSAGVNGDDGEQSTDEAAIQEEIDNTSPSPTSTQNTMIVEPDEATGSDNANALDVQNAEPEWASLQPVGGSSGSSSGTRASEVMQVARISLDELPSDYKSLEISRIIDWMRTHTSQLPQGVKQLVRHRPSFLSASSQFSLDGRTFDLYLMCKEQLYEVHFVLVEDESVTYLVDRSFQKLTPYLRSGQLRRTTTTDILAVRSNVVTGEDSDAFYSVLHSWWQHVKANT